MVCARAGGAERFRWMTQSWLVALYLDCPTDLGLHCPDAQGKAAFAAAVKKGDIYWHAFPHDAWLSLMDPSLIASAVNMTHRLDDQFGVPRKHVYSQRDVSGFPAGAVKPLLDAGVTAVSEGGNGGISQANVPPDAYASRWSRGSSTDTDTSLGTQTLNEADAEKLP